MAISPTQQGLRVEFQPPDKARLLMILAAAQENAANKADAHLNGRLAKIVRDAASQPQHLLWIKEDSYWLAWLGTGKDGVRFTASHHPTCHRRGPWRLLIDVAGGPHHNDWGCFDEADQPLRYFHDVGNLLGEAETIADVLLKERLAKGPIEGWVNHAAR